MATTDGDRLVDKRDRAILMLFIAYGLRAGEVGGLRLDDLDWENEMLQVRCPKPGRTHTYPLSRGVGDAIRGFWSEVQRVYENRICRSLPSSLSIAWNGVLKPRHFLGVRLAVRMMS